MPNPIPAILRPLAAAALCCAALAAALPAIGSATPQAGIDWFAGDVDEGFAKAREQGRPVFLYWGASWCPPCNQVKATIFRRADFIERTRSFVPIAIDGDEPRAQALAARFRVSGYPTMILFSSTGEELLRLQDESDPRQFLDALARGIEGGRSARLALARALASDGSAATDTGPAASPAPGHAPGAADPGDWSLLASFPWSEQEGSLVAPAQLSAMLARLARACPPALANDADRLAFAALVAAAQGEREMGADASAWILARLRTVLEDRARARAAFDPLVQTASFGPVLLLPAGLERREFAGLWERALADLLGSNAGLFAADRLYALMARAQLQEVERGKASPALVREIGRAAQRADRDTTETFARASIISAAGDALAAAGELEAAQRLLEREVARSQSPYYVMTELAYVTHARGDRAGAVDWYAKAVAAARGPATRVQWSARFVAFLVENAPADAARIGAALEGLVGELTPDAATFAGRNLGNLARAGRALAKWNADGSRDAALARGRSRLEGVCHSLPEGGAARASCRGWLPGAGTE